MKRYIDDPYWTRARYKSACRECGKRIAIGEDIFYYPKGKFVLCGGKCGQVASARFAAEVHDEDFYRGQYYE